VKFDYLKRFAPITLVLVLVLGQPATAFAYVGPGAGLSIIGSLLALFAAIVIGIFGFIWFPIRRLLRKRKQAAEQNTEETASVSDESVSGPGEVRKGESDA
jgi:ABC-type bacteriocin/lantibiotic exporter with double-glycine peptidase domain